MSSVTVYPAARRVGAGLLATLAAVAALVAVVCVLAWFWAAAAAALVVLLAATAGFWTVLDGARPGSVTR